MLQYSYKRITRFFGGENENMVNDRQRYQELADFLRTRRERLSPDLLGFGAGQRRRTPGLRREEVAELANISASWYICLEQGRPIRVSAQVLENLARALQLTEEERIHLFMLAHQQPPPVSPIGGETVSVTLQLLLDNMGTCPAYIVDQHLNVLAWNRAAKVMFGDFSTKSRWERNMVWTMFAKISYKQLFVHWEDQARRALAQLRKIYGQNIDNPWFHELIEDLKHASPEFEEWWQYHDVEGNTEGKVEFNHPKVGHLVFEHMTFGVSGNSNLMLKVYTPIPGTVTAEMIKQLLQTTRFWVIKRGDSSSDLLARKDTDVRGAGDTIMNCYGNLPKFKLKKRLQDPFSKP